jgi:hypothetical protein
VAILDRHAIRIELSGTWILRELWGIYQKEGIYFADLAGAALPDREIASGFSRTSHGLMVSLRFSSRIVGQVNPVCRETAGRTSSLVIKILYFLLTKYQNKL